MSLQLKLFFVFAGLLIVAFFTRNRIIETTLMRSFDELEQKSVSDDINRIEHSHITELARSQTMLKDWAQWTATYRFAGGEDDPSRYIKENLMDATFISSGLNLIAIADLKGEIIYAKAFDTDRNQEIPVPEELRELAASGKILAPSETSGREGVVVLGGMPALFSSWSILTSEAEGPSRGSLIMARFMSESIARSYSGILGHPIKILYPGDTGLPGKYFEIGRADPVSFPSYVELLDFDMTRCVMMFPDINGAPAFFLEFVKPSIIKTQGRQTLTTFRLYTMIGAIILVVILLEIMRRQVTARIHRLSNSFGEIAREANFSARVRQEGRDEIGRLATGINRTLEALEKKHVDSIRESHQRMEAEQTAAYQRDCLDAINKFLIESMICDDVKKLALFFLQETRKITGSEFGFVVLDNPETGFDIAFAGSSEDGSDAFETVLFRNTLEDFEYGAIVKTARENKDIVILNKPLELSLEGAEEGVSLPMSSCVCFPAMNEKQIVKAVFLANKPGGYATEVIETIKRTVMVFMGVLMRKRAEIRMVESESRYRTLVSNLSDAIFTLDLPEWKFSSCNQAAIKMFGAELDSDLIGMSPVNLSPPRQKDGSDTVRKARKMVEIALDKGFHYFDWTHCRLDGREFEASVGLSRVVFQGKPTVLATIRDVTEQKRADEALRAVAESGIGSKSNIFDFIAKQLAYTLMKRGAIIATLDHENHAMATAITVWIDGEFREGFSFDLEGTLFADVFHFRAILRQDGAERLLPRFAAMDSWTNSSFWGAPLFDRHGSVIGVIAVIDDKPMTERPQTIALLKSFAVRASSELVRIKTEKKYQTLFESMSEGLAVCDILYDDEGRPADFHFSALNSSFDRISGVRSDRIVGKMASAVIHDSDRHLIGLFKTAALTRRPGSFEVYSKYLDKHFSVTVFSPEPGQLAGIFTNISDRKKAESELEKVLAELTAIHSSAPMAMLLVDRTFRVVKANGSAARYASRLTDEMIGMMFGDAMRCADDKNSALGCESGELCGSCSMYSAVQDAFNTKRRSFDIEKWFTAAPGNPPDDRCFSSSVDFIAYGDSENVLICMNDITKRKFAEVALVESESRYRELVESANSIILRLDINGDIIFINRHAEDLFGYTKGELIGRNIIGSIVPETDSAGRDLKIMVTEICTNTLDFASNENENMRKDGSRIWINWANNQVYNEKEKRIEILCVGTDISARKRAEELLVENEEKMKGLSRKLITAQEEERARLARELHDIMGRHIAALAMESEFLLAKEMAEMDEIRKLSSLAVKAATELRSICKGLRPVELDRLGLKTALEMLARDISSIGRMEVETKIKESDFEGLEDETQISLYRVAQEALTNALKHSGASKARISSSVQGLELVLRIADDGSGFDPETIFEEKDMRFGIIGMKERVLNCGGSVNIISGIGKGTEIVARAPLSARAGEKG